MGRLKRFYRSRVENWANLEYSSHGQWGKRSFHHIFAESVFDFEFPHPNQPTMFSLRSIVHVTTQMRYGQPDAMLGKGELSRHGHGGHYCPEKPFVFWNLLHDQSPGSQLLSISQIFQALNHLSKRRKRRWTRYGKARPELVQWDLEFSYQIMWHSHLSFARLPSQILIMLLMEERAPFSLGPYGRGIWDGVSGHSALAPALL